MSEKLEPKVGQPQPFDVIEIKAEHEKHDHVWEILDVWNPTQLYHPRMAQSPYTTVLVRCRVCELPQTIDLKGTWTLEQITKHPKGTGTTTTGNKDEV